MLIILDKDGFTWDGERWTVRDAKRFFSVPSAVRSLQEQGEDIEEVHFVEDFAIDDYDHSLKPELSQAY